MKTAIHGTILSPWVRRLFAFCEEKGIEYDIVNVVPLGEPDPEFLKISPLGKVPVLEIDGVWHREDASQPPPHPKELVGEFPG